eukprot:1622742-Rhodomonas_salina.1
MRYPGLAGVALQGSTLQPARTRESQLRRRKTFLQGRTRKVVQWLAEKEKMLFEKEKSRGKLRTTAVYLLAVDLYHHIALLRH